jgi:hypothetical protein
MGKETSFDFISIDSDEMQLLKDILVFLRSVDYGELAFTVHTDNNGIKVLNLTRGRKTIYKFVNNG